MKNEKNAERAKRVVRNCVKIRTLEAFVLHLFQCTPPIIFGQMLVKIEFGAIGSTWGVGRLILWVTHFGKFRLGQRTVVFFVTTDGRAIVT